MTVKTGISGLRGTVTPAGTGLTADTIVAYTRAFATHLRMQGGDPLVVMGRDGRRSARMLADLVRGALLSAGCRVVDLGCTLTPTVQYFLSHDEPPRGCAGGVMITASHNPVVWNGLKFLDGQGRFLSAGTWAALHALIETDRFHSAPLDRIPMVHERGEQAFAAHRDAVVAALPAADEIRAAGLRVALDACNGPAVRWIGLLEALGCDVVACHTEQHGYFAREPEPLPAHLGTLRRLVREAGCALGLAADPDGDRLALVDEGGEAVSEEHTVVLCARERLLHGTGPLVVNVVTTHALDEAFPDVAIHRTAVGEMNVVDGVVAHDAILGGEGSGGIIVPAVNLARDGMAAAGLILSLLAESGSALSELVTEIPRWQTVKARIDPAGVAVDAVRTLFDAWHGTAPEFETDSHRLALGDDVGRLVVRVDDAQVVLEGKLADGQQFGGSTPPLRGSNAGGQAPAVGEILRRLARGQSRLDLTDGVKLVGPNAWISLRPSNTEPIIRVMGEVRIA